MVGDTACENITIVDDPDLEDFHTFSVVISGSTPSGSRISTINAFATVQIQDNDGTYYWSWVLYIGMLVCMWKVIHNGKCEVR